MTASRNFRATRLLQVLTIAAAISFAAPASLALAQGSQGEKSGGNAAASQPGDVAGVVVHAPPKLNQIPPDKKAAFDVEAAKRETWKKYRNTTPNAPAAATAGVGASARAENYPGLCSLASH